jgi:chorismate--pyruvate lyase
MKKTINPSWKKSNADIPSPWRTWLLHAGSFMQRLEQQGISDARIQLLKECWQCPEPEEGKLLEIAHQDHAFIREVFILSETKQWMFARTVIPQSTLTGEQQALAHLKNRSLGSFLFKDPTLQRSEFEIAFLQPGERWHSKVAQAVKNVLPDLWARRSLFFLQGKSLLLTEVFLPDIVTI